MATESEIVRRAIEKAKAAGRDDHVEQLEGYYQTLAGPELSDEHRREKIGRLESEIEGMTEPTRRRESYWGGIGEFATEKVEQQRQEEEGPALRAAEGREVPKPALDPSSRAGQTLTSFEIGVKRQVADYFNRKDKAVETRDQLYEHVYNRLSPAEQERMAAPKHRGWDYDSYKNMPFADFVNALDKGGEFTKDDWTELLGEDEFGQMMIGEHPVTDAAGGFYRFFVQPWLSDGELKPSDRLYQSVEKARRHYTDATRESLEKPFVSEEAEALKPWSWFDETTKAPWEDWDGFYYSVAENTPQIMTSIVAARGGGKLGSKLAALQKVDKAEDLMAMQSRLSTAGGIIAGAGTEAMMIRDNVFSEVYDRTMKVDDEKWQENPEYLQLVGAGYDPELAKQMVSTEVATKAGNTAGAVSGLVMGSPMSAFYGRLSAGRFGDEARGLFTNMLRGGAGEAAQEGTQEATEQFLSNLNVSYIDPAQSLTEGLGEAAAGGAMIGFGPGAVGGIGDAGGAPEGFSEAQTEAVNASSAIRKAMKARYDHEQEIGKAEESGSEKSPKERFEDFRKLERLQREEAEAVLENADKLRSYMRSVGAPDVELKMLGRLETKANAMLSDIAAAEAKRTTVAQQLEEERAIQKERAEIEKAVADNMLRLEDVQRQIESIEAIQNMEALPEESYEELKQEGYGRWTGPNQEKFVLLPKGRRAVKELRRQAKMLERQIAEGYTGPERRKQRNDYRRQMIDAADEQTRERLLYEDDLTKLQNRRAFNERAQDAPVVAAVDVDSLKWVNDNMGEHAAGDRLLRTVADALDTQKNVEVYRLGGDEFAVTGASEEVVERALQNAAKQLSNTPIRSGRDQITPSITWGKGATYEEADAEAGRMKVQRAREGKRAARERPPPSLRDVGQGVLLQEGVATPRPWSMSRTGKGDLYIRRHGKNAGKVYKKRQSENDIAISFDGEKLDAQYMYYVIQHLQPQLAERARGTQQQYITIKDIDDILFDFFLKRVPQSLLKMEGVDDDEMRALEELSRELRKLESRIPRHWRDVRNAVEVNDTVEVVGPDGPVVGVVTDVNRAKTKPRLTVNLSGREFVFNPDKNHLIFTDLTDPADVAWLTGDPEYAQPGRETFPQVLDDVQVGRLGREDGWYADLTDIEPVYDSWWADEYPEWHESIPYVPKKAMRERISSPEDLAEAEAIVQRHVGSFRNLPPIQLADSLKAVERISPDTVSEARTMGISFAGVRGFFDENRPDNGIVIIVPNIPGTPGSEAFEQALLETLFHELIGHYGVRGVFGNNNEELRQYMHEVVDAFPEVERIIRPKIPRRMMTADEHKQMVGEEMIAYITGEMMSGTFEPTQKQKSWLKRFFEWIRGWLARRGFIRPRQTSARQEFWNDDRIRDMVARSTDFVRSGKVTMKPWQPNGSKTRYIRDLEIFQYGIVTAIQNETQKLSKAQRKQLAQKYGGMENVPKEIPLFEEESSPNKVTEALRKLKKEGKISKKELELTKLDPDGDWFLPRDLTYRVAYDLLPEADKKHDWFHKVMPVPLAKKFEQIQRDTVNASYLQTGSYLPIDERIEGVGVLKPRELSARQSRHRYNLIQMSDDIMDSKLDGKKAKLTKDMLINYITKNNNVVRIYSQDIRRGPSLSYEDAAYRIFGDEAREAGFGHNLTEEQKRMIREEVDRTNKLGYDIGYDSELNQWFDWTSHFNTYEDLAPVGSGDDYRVTYLVQEGGGLKVGNHGHFDGRAGVIAHIRTAVSTLSEVKDGPPIPVAPNPAMQDRALTMIELQSDWLQAARGAFRSGDESQLAHDKVQANAEQLLAGARAFANGVAGNVTQFLKEDVKAAANLPTGSLGQELEARIRDRFPDGGTESQRREVYIQFRNDLLSDIRTRYQTALTYIEDQWGLAQTEYERLPGTLDARAFDKLDQWAAARALIEFGSELRRLISNIDGLMSLDEVDTFVSNLKMTIDGAMRNFARIMGQSTDQWKQRLPMSRNHIEKMFGEAFKRMGMQKPEELAKQVADMTQKIDRMSVSFPRGVIDEMIKTSRQNSIYSGMEILKQVFDPKRFEIVGVPAGSATMNVLDHGSIYEVEFSGDSHALVALKEKLPDLMTSYVKVSAAEYYEARRQADIRDSMRMGQSRPGDNPLNLSNDYSYDQLRAAWDLIDNDVSGDQDADLDRWDVRGYYAWEEENLDRFRESAEQWAINNIDWDDVTNSAGESLSRSGEAYRERLDIDEDGDVDNSDAEDWLERERDEYMDYLRESDEVTEDAVERAREEWESDPPLLVTGEFPRAWGEDGNPNDFAEVAIVQTDYGEMVRIFIDGEDVGPDYSNHSEAFDDFPNIISEWYNDKEIVPPQGEFFAQVSPPVEQQEEGEEGDSAKPDFDAMADNVAGAMEYMAQEPVDLAKSFRELVELSKRLRSADILPDSPFSSDKIWRTTALKYLIADAVRRGLPAIVWHPGTGSTKRGGFGPEWTNVDKITWSVENMEIQGELQEVVVVGYPGGNEPLVLSWPYALQALGSDVVSHIHRQMKGELPKFPQAGDPTASREPSRDDYLLSQAGNYWIVHSSYDHEFISSHQSQEDAETKINELVEHRRNAEGHAQDSPAGEPAGQDAIASGMVTKESLGSPIRLVRGKEIYEYQHTFPKQPRVAGARASYEMITMNIWKKELEKYGATVGEHWVKVRSENTAEEQGQTFKEGTEREERIKLDHGSLAVKELRGETHGWVVMSERRGVVDPSLYSDRQQAEIALNNYILNNYGRADGAVKVFYIEINDQMRDEFSRPVTPFHFDPDQDPDLKAASEKIGYEPTPMRERIASWRGRWKAEFNQGVFDRFYGIKQAMNRAGMNVSAEYDPYIQARLTTSLDSVMKAVLEFGHPVWKEGIVQTEGKGLMDILQPVLKDIDAWGMYMAGKRAKGLLLEGYAALDENERAVIDKAARHMKGDTKEDKILNVLASLEPTEEVTMTRRDFIKGAAAATGAAGIPGVKNSTYEAARKMVLPELSADRARGRYRSRTIRSKLKKSKRIVSPEEAVSKPEAFRHAMAKRIANAEKITMDKARELIDRVIADALADQAAADQMEQAAKVPSRAIPNDVKASQQVAEKLREKGRERLFTARQIRSMVRLGDDYPVFERVAEEYAAFNKRVLDFAEASGVINPETRPLWENADYVPFYRVEDERLGGPLSAGAGIANLKKPVRRLKGGEANIGNIPHNIMVNLTNLIDSSMKNHAALLAVDSLRPVGIVSKEPLAVSQEMVPMGQVKKLLIEKGMDPDAIPEEALKGFQKMMTIQPPEGEGVLTVMRDGKREYYYSDDMLLYRAMTAINKKAWGAWMNLFRAPKRLLTQLVTLEPGFMIANYLRDAVSAFVLGRDNFVPMVKGLEGFARALANSEEMRTMLSAGAAFESGYINQYDPKATERLIRKAMKDPGFARTVLNSPTKLYEAWRAIGSAAENANRIAVYQAAIRSGKGKAQAVYEAKDLMDFSMGGDWPFIQFLIQSVPFVGARMQGMHRLGRGYMDNPIAFAMKGTLVGLAGLALWFAYREDERYKKLEEWDKDTYFHFWIGENHYRLPKPFEVGAIFNTIPERTMEYIYSNENDAGKLLMRRYGFMLAETFNMNPVPQTFKPMLESYFNHNFFTGRSIVTPYEEDRLPPEQYSYHTSPTMRELARNLPGGLDTVSKKIRSPEHLANLYHGYTATLGRYFLMASDAFIRQQFDHPLPPERPIRYMPVVGRFARGDEPARTKYEEEFYRLLDKTVAVQGSVNFLKKVEDEDRLNEVLNKYEPYIRAADSIESIRENVSDINRQIMNVYMDREMTPEAKKNEIDMLQEQKNILFAEGYQLRPGGAANPNDALQPPLEQQSVIDLIDRFGVDDSSAFKETIEEKAPDTYELLEIIQNDMAKRNILSLARASNEDS